MITLQVSIELDIFKQIPYLLRSFIANEIDNIGLCLNVLTSSYWHTIWLLLLCALSMMIEFIWSFIKSLHSTALHSPTIYVRQTILR